MQNGRRCVAAAQVYWEETCQGWESPIAGKLYMHLPGQRASRCPQEDDLFRPSVAAIFVGVAWNALCAQHLSGRGPNSLHWRDDNSAASHSMHLHLSGCTCIHLIPW
jgi:hypothetical protein